MSALSHSARQALLRKASNIPISCNEEKNSCKVWPENPMATKNPSLEFLSFKLSNVLPQSLAASRARLLHLRRFFHAPLFLGSPFSKVNHLTRSLSALWHCHLCDHGFSPFPPSGSLVESLLERNFWKRLVLAREGVKAMCHVQYVTWTT